MNVIWKPTKKYNAGGNNPNKFIFHWICGTLQSCDNTFISGSREASAHYAVGPTEIHQYVAEGDRAWHCVGQNSSSIGIEHEGWPGHAPERATLDLSAELCADIAKRKGFGKLVWLKNVFPHDYFSNTNCPGELDCAYIIAKANEINGYGTAGEPSKPASTPATSAGLNVDGWWGPKTTLALQKYFGSTQDSVISGQCSTDFNRINDGGLQRDTWEVNNGTGSLVIKKLQGKIGTKADGYFGQNSCLTLQRYLGTTADGVVSGPSEMVKALQRKLNAGNL